MNRRVRVLMAGPDPNANGGVATVVQNYLQSNLVQRCDLRYVTTMVEGGRLRKLAVAARAYAAFARELPKADLVHLHLSKGASYTRKRLLARLAYRQGVPYLIHLHSGEFVNRYQAAPRRVQHQATELFERAAAVIVLSEEWRDAVRAQVCPHARIVVLHNAVELPAEPVHVTNHTVLFSGRLGVRKAPDTLLRAVALLRARIPDLRVIFAGDGDGERYRALAQELGVAAICSFLGWVSDGMERLYAEASVFCLPSRAEGMPMALLEAMAHGMAVVVTPVGGVPQVVRDGENGLIVPVDDEDELSRALATVLEHPQLQRELGERARATIAKEYALSAHVDSLLGLYRAIASENAKRKVGTRAA